jgi:hypothetical protein
MFGTTFIDLGGARIHPPCGCKPSGSNPMFVSRSHSLKYKRAATIQCLFRALARDILRLGRCAYEIPRPALSLHVCFRNVLADNPNTKELNST